MRAKREANYKMADRLKKELFAAIEAAMEKDGISQGEVARRIGAQRYNVNKLMRGKTVASLDFLLKIAESIGLDVELRIKRIKN